jgi:hypothetical protein
VNAPGGERHRKALRMMPAGGSRLALERIDLAIADKRIALGIVRTGVAAFGLPIVVLGGITASGASLPLQPHVVVLAGLLAASAAVGGYLLGRGFDGLAAVDQQLAVLRRRADVG